MRYFIKIVGILIIVFIAAAIGWDGLFWMKTAALQKGRINDLEGRISRMRVRSAAPESNEKAVSAVEGFKKSVPDSNGLTMALSEVFSAAKENGLKIKSGSYNPETAKDRDIHRYTFSFPVEGSYHQLKKFIFDIESMKTPLAIEEVSLLSGESGKSTIAVKVKLSIYFI